MKRTEVIKKLRKIAKAEGVALELTEGGNHTHAVIGDRQTTIPPTERSTN